MEYAGKSSTPTKEFGKEWYIEVLVASSLVLQILLYLVAPSRKRSVSRSGLGLISIIFSLSNWIPAFALILICSRAVFGRHERDTTDGHGPPLLAWASLMLLHLAGHGQERETALSLQLDEIAKESYQIILEFVFYNIIFIFAFIFLFQSWNENTMPTTITFMLLACTRTFAKHKRLQDRIKEIRLGPSTSKLILQPPQAAGPELKEEEVTLQANFLFQTSLKFILGHSLHDHNHNNSKSLYLLSSPENASRIVEAELKLVYHKFYRGVVPSIFELIIVTILFLNAQFPFTPRYIFTIFLNYYICLYGLSFIRSSFSLLPTTIWALAYSFAPFLKAHTHFSDIPVHIIPITHQLVVYPFMLCHCFRHRYHREHQHLPKWSRSIPRFNLLEYSLRKPSKLSASVDYMLNVWSLTGREKYNDEIGEFIFTELRNMILKISDDSDSNLHAANDIIIAAEGQWILKQDSNYQNLVECEAPFEERLLLWHVATGILYHTCSTKSQDDDQSTPNSKMSMLLSDYMGYLLIVQPWIMSKQRGAVLRRCLEMWATINEINKNCEQTGYQTQEMQLKRICEEITELLSHPEEDQNDKTVLQCACVLAQKLESTFPDVNQRWSVIVKVWLEMLAYAAIRCDPMSHIHGLSQGGDLATIIWLWTSHLGFRKISIELENK